MTGSSSDELIGLVLAGGRSRRMGRDKALLEVQGTTLIERAAELLSKRCASVLVSVRADQATARPYRDFPLVIDDGSVEGPAAGLMAAQSKVKGRPLLVLAVDMPLVDEVLLSELAEARDSGLIATAFRHPTGLVEPLCAIWEPAAGDRLAGGGQGARSPSLRGLLEVPGAARLVLPSTPAKLANINTPEALAALDPTAAGAPP